MIRDHRPTLSQPILRPGRRPSSATTVRGFMGTPTGGTGMYFNEIAQEGLAPPRRRNSWNQIAANAELAREQAGHPRFTFSIPSTTIAPEAPPGTAASEMPWRAGRLEGSAIQKYLRNTAKRSRRSTARPPDVVDPQKGGGPSATKSKVILGLKAECRCPAG
jgi:hypothetical protein